MALTLGFIMDPIEHIQFHKDSTLGIILAAQAKGDKLFYIPANNLSVENGEAYAIMHEVKVFDDETRWFELDEPRKQSLSKLDCALMRKDPPFDINYIYATYILELAEKAGVKVINKPRGLRDCNEKFSTTWFPEFTPPSLVSANTQEIMTFVEKHKNCILKPLDGMGGANIFHVQHPDKNTHVIIEHLTRHNQTPCIAQQYIDAISLGDKRVLLFNGKPLDHMVVRVPAADDFRGNLAAGATAKVEPLTKLERDMAERIAPVLLEKGLYLVGLDIIGEYVTEINVTSPTCLRHIDKAGVENASEKCVNMIHQIVKAG